MSNEFTSTFERLWITLRARWCDCHDLDGALALSRDGVDIEFFHRVVQVNVKEARLDELIDTALHHFQTRGLSCPFTLSPLDRPVDFPQRLLDRGFVHGTVASAMVHDPSTKLIGVSSALEVDTSPESEYSIWAEVMRQSFGLPPVVGEVGRAVLTSPESVRYLARVDGVPVATTLLTSSFGMGYVDLVGTLPGYRGKGIASTLVGQAIVASQRLGNRWTALETVSGSAAERLYERLGFRTVHHRHRYTRP